MRRFPSAVMTGSAALFGVLTWTIAHSLTYALFAHIHPGPEPVVHMHGGEWRDALALAAFLGTCALAGIVARAVLSATCRPPRSGRFPGAHSSPAAAACAPAAFVVVEFVQHFASGDEGPPTTLLLIGIGLHAAVGAVSPLLWTEVVRPNLQVILIVVSDPDRTVFRGTLSGYVEVSWARSRVVTPAECRGPPVAVRRFVLHSCTA